MKKSIFYFLSIFLLANAQNNPVIEFTAYFAQLFELKIIEEDELTSFAEHIKENNLINPIDCEQKHCDSERSLHHDTFEEHLLKELDIEDIKIWIQEFINKKKQDKEKRDQTKIETSYYNGHIPQRIAISEGQKCIIDKERKAVCWGPKSIQEESETNKIMPKNMGPLKEISAGSYHISALSEEGKVYTWGQIEREVPLDLGKVVQVSAVPHVTYVLEESRVLKAWGEKLEVNVLAIPKDLGPITQFSLGYHHVCVTDKDMHPRCWGSKNSESATKIPKDINTVLRAFSGEYNTCAILEDDTLKCWGSYASNLHLPDRVGPIIYMAMGAHIGFSISKNGLSHIWGPSNTTPVNTQLADLSPLVQIAHFNEEVCVVKRNAKVECFFMRWKDSHLTLAPDANVPNVEVYIDDLLPLFKFEGE